MEKKVLVKNNPIIAAVRDVSLIEKAVLSPVETIFLMTGDIFSIEHCVEESRKYHKSIFLHVDLIKGIANDREGIKYLSQKVKPDGIVSTKNQLIQAAKKEGLLAIQHLFMLDTQAYENGIRNVSNIQPDAIEIMPGLMPRVIREFYEKIDCPIITAGLIKHPNEIREAIEAGAHGVAIGEPELWNTDYKSI
ncbi:glycerol-3-phosphate responsive antiterminator [Bacillus sp. CMF12]|uniref:glycerol-3-phosphate responsive antiterminator n=1 Tax=Bacillaceae TaxID=186817 RepID=UPI001FB4355C|nr:MULTISPECIES: glycerol-3-phosphate responsive antiterminator [Bacillaceae]UOE53358.1 glycerol-3-phosphate responsive antiterminator [Cytobacillus oceanisediminis]USK47810.1 glycerol-3-phosphate responsive antiterminator [Bacillus sp. CMF12]